MTDLRSGRVAPRDLPEGMDAPDCGRIELADALDVLGRSGRYLGGHRLLRGQVIRLLERRRPGVISLLDVGSGGGDGAAALAGALRGRGWAPRLTMADLHGTTLDLCRARLETADPSAAAHATFVRLDGAALPFADDAFDVVMSSTTLHHLEDDDARALLGEFDRVSRIGWVLTDLRRSAVALAAVRLLAATAWRGHALPRIDGPISVRRSFTAPEVRRLIGEAGIGPAVVIGRIVRWAARGSVAAR